VEDLSPAFPVHDPAEPDAIIGYAPAMDQRDAREAILKASEALPSWRDGTTAAERARLLLEWSRLLLDNTDDIATIMTLESGKPIAESRGEVTYARSFLDYYAAEAIRPTGAGGGFLVPTPFADSQKRPRGQIMAIQQAVGVCALIIPWNFPIAMVSCVCMVLLFSSQSRALTFDSQITRKVGPALAAGCTAVFKPANLTPLTAVALHKLGLDAGIPPDVFQLVTSDETATPDVGTEFCTNPIVSKVSFTGSVAVGKRLMSQCSSTVKRLSLELGGNAPFVVFDDADLDQAVDAAMASKFRNAGQTCVCADRFLIHASIYDEFVSKLVEKTRALNVGPGIDESNKIGPLISSKAVKEVDEKVKEAISEGCQCLVGGHPLSDIGPQFYAPTILGGVSPQSRIWNAETFGPVAALMSFETDQEALSLSNDTTVGLAAYFCTKDLSRAFHFARSLECGLVGVNEGIISTANAPFGGVKESGFGREGSSLGMAEYLETKYVFMNY
jgi:succinate-semialdehyde dehydrogenase/glutarate-semialdehyde dehydrogenase